MKRKKIAIVTAVLLLIVSAGIYFYYGVVFKEARNIASEAADFSVTAKKLLEDYNADPKKADSLYLNKTIEITGKATKETDSVIILENTVFCLFKEKLKNKMTNNKMTIKGKCIGYDELFMEVKIDQCTVK
ncbi:OB-fold putative lipoprotein [Flavobacterium tyrosinilyticum]|uniref:OB-fold putative lipoprotein n=1 Tax=Flavobacterium tyrosinilyticum TaxID=1658740 RepID=UPI00202F3202|nr:OB-fold putative lipoprotein [Flavobacterium tyrosinilyticum]MCM0667699.1 OB-fold putative lipoprotein [Flavobacterium tyrosinilyticum]